MKEINAAYEEINRRRGSRRWTAVEPGSTQQSGYGGYAVRRTELYAAAPSVLQQVPRLLFRRGDLSRAEALLANYSDHNAEWHFLRGAVCYRKGLAGRG